jgi:hypothetical protein
MLLAELLLRVTQVRLGLRRNERASRADLPLDRGDGLASDLADRVRNARDVRDRRDLRTELLDP